jgi:hypothetical protein
MVGVSGYDGVSWWSAGTRPHRRAIQHLDDSWRGAAGEPFAVCAWPVDSRPDLMVDRRARHARDRGGGAPRSTRSCGSARRGANVRGGGDHAVPGRRPWCRLRRDRWRWRGAPDAEVGHRCERARGRACPPSPAWAGRHPGAAGVARGSTFPVRCAAVAARGVEPAGRAELVPDLPADVADWEPPGAGQRAVEEAIEAIPPARAILIPGGLSWSSLHQAEAAVGAATAAGFDDVGVVRPLADRDCRCRPGRRPGVAPAAIVTRMPLWPRLRGFGTRPAMPRRCRCGVGGTPSTNHDERARAADARRGGCRHLRGR